MGKFCVVCTDKRGVFAGEIVNRDDDKKTITLKDVRMCVKWSADMKGVFGLASVGPSNTCRITKAVKSIDLNGVTCVMDVTPDAKKKWEDEPWG